ncbi:MAG TPA: NuoF family protein [Gemmataceae bacterium]|nr:NuoF family protein [Gemmataceae bacterium]
MELSDLLDIAVKERASCPPHQIRCCTAAGCLSAGSAAVLDRLRRGVDDTGMAERVRVAPVGCMRLCCQGPLVQVDPSGEMYQQVTPDDADSIVAGLNGGTVTAKRGDPQAPFFALQASVILENSGKVEPERIETYIAAEGYQALYHVLRNRTPAQVIEEITRSGLRGRGGAAYPTGVKWATVAKNPGEVKYVVCNADEGDPGAFMNRSVLESDPHRVLEGMAIAGHAIGASQGYIYVRGEYPLAVQRLQTAIEQANRLGVLGAHIFSSPFIFRIDLRTGAGAFVCGEETALMASIMGQRGMPTPRPPYPAEHGLWGMPTLLNNVETFANVPGIIRRGADWFAAIGAEKSKGTKVFCLTGKVVNTGLVEVPLGTPIRKIVQEIGGGAPEGGTIKAVQTGGPSGGCIPAELFDTPVDYESLARLGSIMGSGGMIVLDQNNSMVDVARFFMQFCMDESCGKCVPCRAGTVQLHRLLTRILGGSAGAEDLQQLEMLCDMVKHTSLCGLGQTAPNPTLSTLRYFRHEYEALLKPGSPAQRMGLPLVASVSGNGIH